MKGTLEWLGQVSAAPVPGSRPGPSARRARGRVPPLLARRPPRTTRTPVPPTHVPERGQPATEGQGCPSGSGAPGAGRTGAPPRARGRGGAAGVEMAGPERGPPAADRQQRHVDRHREVADPGEDVGVASEIDRATAAYDEADRLRLGREAMPAPIVIGRSRADGERND